MKHSKSQVKSGLIWSAIDSIGNQALNLMVSLVLANILGPTAYGLVAMMTIFVAVAGVFVNSGFNSALIRKVDRNESDYVTTFYFSFGMSLLFYSILYFTSVHIAEFYDQPELISLIKVVALVIVIDTFAIIPRTKLTIALNFKQQAKANLIALFASGSVALYMAYHGYGVWSLVAQQITKVTVSAIIFNVLTPWYPTTPFSKKSFETLFGFGSKLLVSGLIDTIYNNMYGLIIGKQFSASHLGIYNQANTLSSMPAMTITNVIQRVTYPMLSQIQNDVEKLEEAYLITLQIAAMVVFPVLLGLSIISDPLIRLLLGQRWLESAPLISILTIGMALYPIHAINLNFLQVKGRSDLFLKLEIIKKIIITIMLVITVPLGITAMCVGIVITSFIALIINTYYTGKLSKISQFRQLNALYPIGLYALVSAILGYLIADNIQEEFLKIVVSLSVALLCYMSMMAFFQQVLMYRIKAMLVTG